MRKHVESIIQDEIKWVKERRKIEIKPEDATEQNN